MFLHIAACGTGPQKDFIQSRADTFIHSGHFVPVSRDIDAMLYNIKAYCIRDK